MEETPVASETAPSTETATTETVVTDNGVDTGTEVSYANGKYKSVSDLENGYSELQKSYSAKLGGFDGAPEAYELGEGMETTPRIDALQAWGKENQLSNDALNSIIAMDQEASQKATEAYVSEQKEQLGKDADTRLTNISDWARATFGEESMDTFNGMITSAKGVELFENAMKTMQGTAPAPAQAPQAVSKESLNEMRFAVDKNSGERRMSIDPAYRARVEQLEREAFERRA